MANRFPGFPKEGLAFFKSLERNNNRDWFQPRKHIYEEKLRQPMMELVQALNLEMARWAPDHIVEPQRSIYRVYRDTRFSNDKTPYKTHIAAIFPRRGTVKHACAGLYFEISHKAIEVAGGVYMPPPENILAIRQMLVNDYAELEKILGAKKFRELLGELQGQQLARVPKGFAADHPSADWVRYKQWYVYKTMDVELATTPQLLPELAKRFKAMMPLVDFFNRPFAHKRVTIPPEELFG